VTVVAPSWSMGTLWPELLLGEVQTAIPIPPQSTHVSVTFMIGSWPIKLGSMPTKFGSMSIELLQ